MYTISIGRSVVDSPLHSPHSGCHRCHCRSHCHGLIMNALSTFTVFMTITTVKYQHFWFACISRIQCTVKSFSAIMSPVWRCDIWWRLTRICSGLLVIMLYKNADMTRSSRSFFLSWIGNRSDNYAASFQ